MKRSKKLITIISIFFLVIAGVIIARTMISSHFQKKFSKIPPPGIIVTKVKNENFFERIESFGTAISKKTTSFRVKKKRIALRIKTQRLRKRRTNYC
mgnify:CR=1 FL=1